MADTQAAIEAPELEGSHLNGDEYNGYAPVTFGAPSIHRPTDVSDGLRVASTSPMFIAINFINTPPSIETKTFKKLPIAGVIVTSQKLKLDADALLRWDRYRPLNTDVVTVPFFTTETSNQKTLRRLQDFAKRYATVVQSGRIPVVQIKKPGYGERITFKNDPHAQAFFAGMVAAALCPQGVVAVCNDERITDSAADMEFRDSLALAASQGRHALMNRRIVADGPSWSHIGAQMARFDRQLMGFHTKHQNMDSQAQYVWTARDPRSIHGDPRFAPDHVAMLQMPVSGEYKTPAWVERMVNYLRPGSDHDENPSRQIDAFRRYLASNGPAMGQRPADVLQKPVRAVPEQAEAAPVAKRRLGS